MREKPSIFTLEFLNYESAGSVLGLKEARLPSKAVTSLMFFSVRPMSSKPSISRHLV
jgi:hypothetical protein